MFIKVITLVSLASTCYGEIEPYAHHHVEAKALQNIPVSPKFKTVYFYTTPQPQSTTPRIQEISDKPETIKSIAIQYAPVGKTRQRYEKHNYLEYLNPYFLRVSNEKAASNYNLEPKLSQPKPPVTSASTKLLPGSYKHFEYAQGHNIEVLEPGGKEPSHNTVYKRNPSTQENIEANDSKFNSLDENDDLIKNPTTKAINSLSSANDQKNKLIFSQFKRSRLNKEYESHNLPKVNVPQIVPKQTGSVHVAKRPILPSFSKSPFVYLNVGRPYSVQPHNYRIHPNSYTTEYSGHIAYTRSLLKALNIYVRPHSWNYEIKRLVRPKHNLRHKPKFTCF